VPPVLGLSFVPLPVSPFNESNYINYTMMMQISTKPSIDTSKIFKESELDKGFVLRANDSVARTLRELIRSTSQDNTLKNRNLEILNLDPDKHLFG
jgi:hypothetical protein